MCKVRMSRFHRIHSPGGKASQVPWEVDNQPKGKYFLLLQIAPLLLNLCIQLSLQMGSLCFSWPRYSQILSLPHLSLRHPYLVTHSPSLPKYQFFSSCAVMSLATDGPMDRDPVTSVSYIHTSNTSRSTRPRDGPRVTISG